MATESIQHSDRFDEVLTREEYELVNRFRAERGEPHDPVTPISKLRDRDRMDEIYYQARGIIDVIRCASTSGDECPDDAIPGACWALKDLLDELKNLDESRG